MPKKPPQRKKARKIKNISPRNSLDQVELQEDSLAKSVTSTISRLLNIDS